METRTTCPYCGVGCGVAARGKRAGLKIAGDAGHPANFGRLCSKGSALGDTVRLDGRLLHPIVHGQRTNWAHAISLVARTFRETIVKHGPDSVAFYVSGQLLTEDYYVANKLMKGFIGSGNIDTNSRLCMASAVAAQKLAFGEDAVPACYDDLEQAKLVVFSGHNAAWTHPVLYRRMEEAVAHGQRHIVIDPRETDTARGAALHLKIRSQTDVRLWNGLLAHLDACGAIDRAFIAAHTSGFDDVLKDLARDDQHPNAVAADCGLPVADVMAFYAAFAATPKTVTLFSQGANQSIDGVAKGLSIINAHLATGRIGKPGAAPFSITGQPNAMGGRETGGMANTLAAHREFNAHDIDAVKRFWNAPRCAAKPGLKAVDMFDALANGRIKAIWIMATNPVVSMPDADRVRDALKACPFVVVSDVIGHTDTAKLAHVLLPAQAWGEKDGTVTNSERRISRQRALMPPPGGARADWRVLRDVARAMGFGEAFPYETAADVFRDYAALTRFENDGAPLLNLGALADLDQAGYDAMKPVQWPVDKSGQARERLFADGRFSTPDGRARFHTARSEARVSDPAFPFTLNTGRIRDQWHTMTRTGLAAKLMRHEPEPYVEIHSKDAERLGVEDGVLAHVTSPFGAGVFKAKVSSAVRRGELFAPMHWSGDFAPQARANALVNPIVDARSGQPEFKRTPAAIAPACVAWRAFLVSRDVVALPDTLWWRRIPQEAGHLYEIAAAPDAPALQDIAEAVFQDVEAEEIVSASDSAGRFARKAAIVDGRLQRAFFATRGRGLPQRAWLIERLGTHRLSDEDRQILLAGGIAPARASSPCVCACFDVSRAEIESFALASAGVSVMSVGAALKAGSNCGSCKPEIAHILTACRSQADEAA